MSVDIREATSKEIQKNIQVVKKGAFHAFATTGTQAPETATILKENVEFIKENMVCYKSF